LVIEGGSKALLLVKRDKVDLTHMKRLSTVSEFVFAYWLIAFLFPLPLPLSGLNPMLLFGFHCQA